MSEATENTPRFGRAFNAAVGADWMITEDGFRTLLSIAARLPVNKAVEAEDSPALEYTRTCDIRDGVAIIPVDGPIFRYANFFTYFSGGSSVDVLGKDFNSALNNPSVHAILFEINSPGGEVTGINEFTEMIFAARSKKPITARVGGLGCSAAYWIASACGDIAIDETAMLGSIGVMAVYTDDRKWLEMNGIEEIEFISSQSPYKNAPPWADEGRKRIQRRIDALAQVFVDKVARNRDVTVETVLKEFGQGDVFVGQASVDAGLADRLGSFEGELYRLAKTHNPYFVDDRAEAAKEITIKEKALLESESVETAETDKAGDSKPNGENMADEKKDLKAGADTQEPAAAAEPKEQPAAAAAAAAPAAVKETAKADPTSSDEVATLRSELAKSNEIAAKAAERIEKLEAEAQDKWIADQVKGLQGETEAQTKVLGSLVSAYGKDSDEVKAYLELQTAQASQIETGGLFSETGKSGAGSEDSVEAKISKMAKERALADKITYEQAYTVVLNENPELFAAHEANK